MSVKPNAKKIKRDTLMTEEASGYLDFIRIAFDADLTAYPVAPPLTDVMTYGTYATATGQFAPSTINLANTPVNGQTTIVSPFSKVEVNQNSIKVETKPMGTLMDASAVETTLTFKMDNSPLALGLREMTKRADVQIVLERTNGENVWIGRPNRPANMGEFNEPLDISATAIDFTFKVMRYGPLYLATKLDTYSAATVYEGHETGA